MAFFKLPKAGVSIVLTMLLMAPIEAAQADQSSDLISKGKYLTAAGGCVSCHTKPGAEAFSGDRAIPTPFGTLYSPNITPDKDTGIGNYTDDQFYRTLHDGIAGNGEYLYPAMPFTSYTNVKREDALAIKAYLFSLKPVHSESRPNGLAFPFNIRESMAAWRTLYFKPGEFQPDPNKSAQINRGAYLVQGLAHCGQCHTPRNIAGANESGDALQGAAVQGWYAPNITSNWAEGIGSWSNEELLSYFKKGIAPGHGIAIGPMSEVVHDDLKYLTDDDLNAIVAYLKSTPPKAEETAFAGTATEESGRLFVNNCASCHQLNGQGIAGKIPALANNGAVKAQGPQNVVKVMLAGLAATDTFGPMPSFAWLSDDQIAAIANYVRTKWGNNAPADADGFLVAGIPEEHPINAGARGGRIAMPVEIDGRRTDGVGQSQLGGSGHPASDG